MNKASRARDATDILELRVSGLVDEETIEALVRQYASCESGTDLRWLVHTSTARVAFDAGRLAEAAERIRRSCRSRAALHVIAEDELTYGCMRMLSAYLSDTGLQVRVYSDGETARRELTAA